MTRSCRIASVPADGIGPEVIAAGLEVLEAVAAKDGGFKLVVDHYDWGSNWYRKHGEFMPADGLAWLRTADAIYFGAVGDPNILDHISLWGLRLQIWPLRDVGPGDLDWVIVRENSEGEYAGQGGRALVQSSIPSVIRNDKIFGIQLVIYFQSVSKAKFAPEPTSRNGPNAGRCNC